MFSTEEQALLTGRDADVQKFLHSDRCMVVDWRSTEDEALDDLIRFLPNGAFSYEMTYPGAETVAIRLRFHGREDLVTLPFRPQNNFRVLLRAARLIRPDYDIMLFRCTEGADTHGFLVRPAEWWNEYRVCYPKHFESVFGNIAVLQDIWHLDKPASNPPDLAKRAQGNIFLRFIYGSARLFRRRRFRQNSGARGAQNRRR